MQQDYAHINDTRVSFIRACDGVARAARRGAFPLSRNDVVYPERSNAIAWMSRSRGQGRAHASPLVVPVTCKGPELRSSRASRPRRAGLPRLGASSAKRSDRGEEG